MQQARSADSKVLSNGKNLNAVFKFYKHINIAKVLS